MKKISNLKKLIISLTVLFIICLGLLTFSLRINIRRFVDKAIYSNEFHYLECSKMPNYEVSKTKFDQQKSQISELIQKIETEYTNSPNRTPLTPTIWEDQVSGGYISIKLSKICGDKAELNIDFTSNNFLPEIKKFLNQNLTGIPYNLVNG